MNSSPDAPFFSLVIPVYKVERFLPDALASVREQTFTDYEVLCVDDGSPDGSGALLDEAARGDARLRVIHQRNAGVSAARNRALDRVRGTYVLFLDPDDAICPEWFNSFAKVIDRYNYPQQVRFGDRRFQEDEDWRAFPNPVLDETTCKVAEGELDCARLLWPRIALPDSVWRMAWLADFIQSFRFPVGVIVGEDCLFHLKCYPALRHIVIAAYPGVYYRMRSGSAVMRGYVGSRRTQQHLTAISAFLRLLRELRGDVRRPIAAFYLTSYAWQSTLGRPLKVLFGRTQNLALTVPRNPKIEAYIDRVERGARGGLNLAVTMRVLLLMVLYALEWVRYRLYLLCEHHRH